MKFKKIQILILTVFTGLFLECAPNLTDIKKQDPKLFKALVRDYLVASEENIGKVELLQFIEDETQSITGKINKFPIESCTWFFDRKVKNKYLKKDVLNVPKTINLNCGGQYYIIELDKKNLQASKIKYKGVYKDIFDRLNKAVILEASCSVASINYENDEDENASIECYPYPFDINRYMKTRKREVVAGYFLYTNSQETLDELMGGSKEEKENEIVLQALIKDFVNDQTANNRKLNSSVGKKFPFKNCEYIDFREVPVENAKGKELREKTYKFIDSDLNDPANKEGLRDAIEEYRSCGNRCISKEKEIQIIFEIKNLQAKRKILLIKKINSKSELSKYKRFKYYSFEGTLRSIDFSVKGDIEKIYLNSTTDNEEPRSETKSESKIPAPNKEETLMPESETKPIPEPTTD